MIVGNGTAAGGGPGNHSGPDPGRCGSTGGLPEPRHRVVQENQQESPMRVGEPWDGMGRRQREAVRTIVRDGTAKVRERFHRPRGGLSAPALSQPEAPGRRME